MIRTEIEQEILFSLKSSVRELEAYVADLGFNGQKRDVQDWIYALIKYVVCNSAHDKLTDQEIKQLLDDICNVLQEII